MVDAIYDAINKNGILGIQKRIIFSKMEIDEINHAIPPHSTHYHIPVPITNILEEKAVKWCVYKYTTPDRFLLKEYTSSHDLTLRDVKVMVLRDVFGITVVIPEDFLNNSE